MMIPAILTSELSNTSSSARSRQRLPNVALCLLGLLGSMVVGCDGQIDENLETGSARPAANAPASGSGDRAPSAPAVTSNTGDDTDPSDVSASERALEDLDRASSGSRSNTGGGRSNDRDRDRDRDRDDDRDDEELVDAGALDAGEADAGEADADVIEADAGEVDAGEADAGSSL
jgi:hypothetical protein